MTVERLLSTARKELGIKEQPADSNRVKYNTAYYGREVSGGSYAWCAVFLWWCFREAGASELILRRGKNGLLSHSPVLPQGAGRVRLSPWRRHFLQL